jgi:hypothetical protein
MRFRKSLFVLSVCALLACCSAVQAGYIDNGDGTVTDNDTCLMWQQDAPSRTYTWEQALAYCEHLELATYTDWRLPTVRELSSIVDTTRYDPAINITYFSDTVMFNYYYFYYWSSTTYALYSDRAWSGSFYYGYMYAYLKADGNYVRAVRSGQCGSFDNLTLWPVPDTGQSPCYDNDTEISCPSSGQPFYGQDASYSINTLAYTKLAAGCKPLPDNATTWAMVLDEVTGLVWEEKHAFDNATNYADPNDADNYYTWYDNNSAANGGNAGKPGDGTDTMDFINALNTENYGGYSDWRMPTVKELLSIVDYGRYGPSINTTYFQNVFSYRSSTTFADSSDKAWYVYFGYGSAEADSYKYEGMYVRAVRSGQCESFCELNIAPKKIFKLLAALNPFIPFLISADRGSGAVFAQPIEIDWGTDAINDILRLKIGKRIIFGVMLVRPLKLEAGELVVTVTFGDSMPICAGTLDVK